MHALSVDQSGDDPPDLLAVQEETEGWQLSRLKPMHLQAATLLGQGLKNIEVAAMCGITPQYVTRLLQQPLFIAHVQKMSAVAGVQLEALYPQVVEVIGDAMTKGNLGEKLKGARLHLEATKRIGAGSQVNAPTTNSEDRLTTLAERLVGLLAKTRTGVTLDGTATETVQDAEVISERRLPQPGEVLSAEGIGEG